MAVIHFLNVKQGDCTWIKHNDGKITVIDVCNAYKENTYSKNSLLGSLSKLNSLSETSSPRYLGLLDFTKLSFTSNYSGLSNFINNNKLSLLNSPVIQTRTALLEKPRKNFNQKAFPVNPINYLKKHGVNSVFRFILTHPDMDHMDGIKDFFEEFKPLNFWDIDNKKEMNLFKNSPYSEEDWNYYKNLRDGKITGTKRLTLLDNARGKYYNQDESGNNGGNGLYILNPLQELIGVARKSSDYHECSYVILYKTGNKKIIFGGDSQDRTWEYILNNHKNDIKDIDLLIAPHHGRDSSCSYDFLKILKPKLTFFGNASSEHLAYEQWSRRGLEKITNNEGNCLIVKIDDTLMNIFVTHHDFAKEYTNNETYFDYEVSGWHIKTL